MSIIGKRIKYSQLNNNCNVIGEAIVMDSIMSYVKTYDSERNMQAVSITEYLIKTDDGRCKQINPCQVYSFVD